MTRIPAPFAVLAYVLEKILIYAIIGWVIFDPGARTGQCCRPFAGMGQSADRRRRGKARTPGNAARQRTIILNRRDRTHTARPARHLDLLVSLAKALGHSFSEE